MTDLKIVPGGSASVHILHEGYVGRDGDDERVAGTVTLIIDGTAVIVVDPGMVASRAALLAALAGHGPQATDVTDVVFSHHHPDHTVNAALFPAARIHDHWAVYEGDRWIDRDADGAELAPAVRLLRTPGHTAQDLHGGVHPGRRLRLHPRVVVRRRPRRRSARLGRRGSARQPGPAAVLRHGDRARSRSRLPPRPQHAPLARHPPACRRLSPRSNGKAEPVGRPCRFTAPAQVG